LGRTHILDGPVFGGWVTIIMKLLNDERPLRSSLLRFYSPKSGRLLFLFAVVAPIAVNLAMFVTQENLSLRALASLRWGDFVRLFLVNILLAPLWEEIGWRGFLLPTLSKKTGLGRAALGVGLIWGSWHFALYHSVLRVSMYSYLISFGVIMAMSLVLAVLYSAAENTLLLPILFHASWNAATNWVIGAATRYDLGPIMVQGIAVWILAGLAWLHYRHRQEEPAPRC
jgi:membrane protease YdiL (CAAX protease family)